MNSRDKGKRGERELAKVLTEYGFSCRRGQQYNGADGSADVIGLSGVHIECKRVERLNIHEAMKQASEDARAREMPVVMHRKNGEKWLATMKLEDWIQLYKGEGDEHS